MKKYQYRWVRLSAGSISSSDDGFLLINKLAEEGWRVISTSMLPEWMIFYTLEKEISLTTPYRG